jgi:hypothetical protein
MFIWQLCPASGSCCGETYWGMATVVKFLGYGSESGLLLACFMKASMSNLVLRDAGQSG